MKASSRTFHQIAKDGSDFIIYKDKDIGDILFGCPSDIVKYFNLKKMPIPTNIVIPQRTFQKGKSYLDIEFIIYFILFFQKYKKSLTVICSELQEERVRTVLKEALFGPLLKDIFRVFLLESFSQFRFKKTNTNFLEALAEKIGDNREVFFHFKEIMVQKLEDAKLIAKMRSVLHLVVGDVAWMNEETNNRFISLTTKAYVKAAMLKQEMIFFAMCKEEERDGFLNNLISFCHFDLNGNFTINNGNGSRLKICQSRTGHFRLYKNKKLIDSFHLQKTNENKKPLLFAPCPMEIPEFGITFLGSGTGFDSENNTSCFIIWINGKGIAVDLLANCEEHFRELGIASSDITHVFLSHLHADHDAGILEKMFSGEKIHLLTSNLIFDCFLSKAEATTRFTKSSIREFVNFTNLEVGKEIRIPGIERTHITFDYAFHSIPTGRFKLKYKSLAGKEVSIGVSGDTKFDKKLVNKLYNDGIITASRRDDILGFIWDCDLIIHEAGGGMLHTEVKDLSGLPMHIKKKCILTHMEQKKRESKCFQFAMDGQSIPIIKQKHDHFHFIDDFVPLLRNTGLFFRFTSKQFNSLLRSAAVEVLQRGQYVFKQGEVGHKFYIILSGFAEVIKNKRVISVYEKGNFFGELALINKNRKRTATVKAKSKLCLMSINRSIYNKFEISTVIKEQLYELTNYFTDTTSSSLIGYISRGRFMVFMKGENIIEFGDICKDVHILIDGEVDVLDENERLIVHIADVEVLGEIAYLKQIPRTATVRVTTKEATTICLDYKLFVEITKKFPFFYATILKKMERRLDAME